VGAVFAQQGVTQCGVPTGQPKFPLLTYQELPDPTAPSDKEWAAVTSTQVSWGTTDVRYAKHQLPQLKKQQTVSLKGWRGERVNAQAVVWTGVELKDLNFSFGDFKDKKGNVLPKDAFTGGFVRYVMTDELNKDGRGACGHRKSIDYDSLLVADPIDTNLKTMALPARTVQPVWVQCWIPQSATPGTYQGELLINDGSRLLQRLNLEITVSSRELPQPSEWAYHLDLWQSPYAVARYYQVPLWSQEHFDAMRPLMKMLADAGQKIITATLTHKPWNGQTEDYFDTMVTWMKRADGTWAFDYTIFDRWVEFMMSVGIDKQINCYSMVPWELSFQYYDQATNSLQLEWAYHLDLWQSPYAVARYYQVPLWSQEHFDAMRPLMKMLADAGQKIITATLTHKPWNGQTEDYFDTMVTWMKRADGTWAFDYTIFDRWVEFMMSVGIDKQINCYSMVPWELSFQYYDQATNSLQFVKTAPGDAAYEEMWGAMLASFSKHLKEKGWFDICAIAMDERPMEVMQKTLKVIRKADPDFKVSLAGNYHEEIEPDLYDYCIVIGQNFPEEVRLRRVAENKRTNYYTCCTEAHPNTFTFSDPAEAAWMSYYSSKKHLDGYLRWAYNSWPLEPLLDSRFRSWAGGDTYLVYPGARSCIRFERLIEGIQAHEKINILRQEFEKKGNKAGLKKIEKMLAPFNLGSMPEIPAAITVNRANQILNSF